MKKIRWPSCQLLKACRSQRKWHSFYGIICLRGGTQGKMGQYQSELLRHHLVYPPRKFCKLWALSMIQKRRDALWCWNIYILTPLWLSESPLLEITASRYWHLLATSSWEKMPFNSFALFFTTQALSTTSRKMDSSLSKGGKVGSISALRKTSIA